MIKWPFISIRQKIFATVLLLILLLFIIISTIVYFMFMRSFVQSEVNNTINSTNNTNHNLDFILRQVENTATIISANNSIKQEVEAHRSSGTVHQILSLDILSNVQDIVSGIHIITPDQKIYTSSGSIDKNYEMMLLDYLNMQKDNPEAIYTGLQTVTLSTGFTFSAVSYVRPIFDYVMDDPISVLVVDIDYVRLREILTATSLDDKEWVLITDDKNNRIFNYPYNMVLDDQMKEMPQFFKRNTVEYDKNIFGNKMIVASIFLEKPNWTIIRFIPYDRIQDEIDSIQLRNVIIILLAVFVSFIISYYIARIITLPIKEIHAQFKIAEKGDFSARVNISSRDEFGELGIAFNKMVIRLKALINERLKEQKQKSDFEFEILQAQINPHFLYNTLDSIKWLAVIQNVDNIAEVTNALINLLKYNISVKAACVSLSEEVDNIKNYIIIQRYRFGNTFDTNYDISVDALECGVLHFMLQPLVENSLLHGLEGIDYAGLITIRAYTENDKLFVVISDNGVGIDEKTLNNIRSSDKNNKFNRIGINNVRDRIKLYFGVEYGLDILSEKDQGTQATICLPIVKMS